MNEKPCDDWDWETPEPAPGRAFNPKSAAKVWCRVILKRDGSTIAYTPDHVTARNIGANPMLVYAAELALEALVLMPRGSGAGFGFTKQQAKTRVAAKRALRAAVAKYDGEDRKERKIK